MWPPGASRGQASTRRLWLQVLIQNGELVTGTLCKKTLGASQGSLIHVIWNEEGPEAARAFLSQSQFCVNYWLLQHGMSIGIGDTVANADTMMKITNIIAGVGRLPCPRPLQPSVSSIHLTVRTLASLLHQRAPTAACPCLPPMRPLSCTPSLRCMTVLPELLHDRH